MYTHTATHCRIAHSTCACYRVCSADVCVEIALVYAQRVEIVFVYSFKVSAESFFVVCQL